MTPVSKTSHHSLTPGSLEPTAQVSGAAQTPRAPLVMPKVWVVVAGEDGKGGVRWAEGEGVKPSAQGPRSRPPHNGPPTSFLPQAVPLGHGLEHPLGSELVQIIAVNHNLSEVRGFQNLQLEHGFAHLLDVRDSRSVWACLGKKMSAAAPGGGRGVKSGLTHQTWLPAAASGPGTPRGLSGLREL